MDDFLKDECEYRKDFTDELKKISIYKNNMSLFIELLNKRENRKIQPLDFQKKSTCKTNELINKNDKVVNSFYIDDNTTNKFNKINLNEYENTNQNLISKFEIKQETINDCIFSKPEKRNFFSSNNSFDPLCYDANHLKMPLNLKATKECFDNTDDFEKSIFKENFTFIDKKQTQFQTNTGSLNLYLKNIESESSEVRSHADKKFEGSEINYKNKIVFTTEEKELNYKNYRKAIDSNVNISLHEEKVIFKSIHNLYIF